MNKLVLLDGAVGTGIWEKTQDKLPVWTYNITHPETVRELADEYAAAGAQILLANTFGANRPAVSRSSSYTVEEVITAAVRIAREAVRGTQIKVALAAGPLAQLMEPFGDLTEEETAEIYGEMFRAGIQAGADLIMLQTFIDLEMMRVAAAEAKKYGVPVFCTMTFEAVGKTMFGNSVEDVIGELTPLGIDAIGMNCSIGPDKAVPIIREFAQKTELPLIFKPNAGKPILSGDGQTVNPYSREDFVREVQEAFPYIKYVGGCCGTNAAYIALLKEKVDQYNGFHDVE